MRATGLASLSSDQRPDGMMALFVQSSNARIRFPTGSSGLGIKGAPVPPTVETCWRAHVNCGVNAHHVAIRDHYALLSAALAEHRAQAHRHRCRIRKRTVTSSIPLPGPGTDQTASAPERAPDIPFPGVRRRFRAVSPLDWEALRQAEREARADLC